MQSKERRKQQLRQLRRQQLLPSYIRSATGAAGELTVNLSVCPACDYLGWVSEQKFLIKIHTQYVAHTQRCATTLALPLAARCSLARSNCARIM